MSINRSRKRKKAVSAATIARLADQGKDVSRFFTNSGLPASIRAGQIHPSTQRVMTERVV